MHSCKVAFSQANRPRVWNDDFGALSLIDSTWGVPQTAQLAIWLFLVNLPAWEIESLAASRRLVLWRAS